VPVVTRTSNGATVSLRSPFLLTLRTTAPCWVDITDTSGTTLFAATLPGGQQQQIPGSGPIVMKLGNMSAMKISANGVDLDLSGLPQTANVTFQPV
jgi:cytoskeleton protein RodZ